MKRITLTTNLGEFQSGVDIELEDEKADALIKRGKAMLASQQTVYAHEDEMSDGARATAHKALAAADAAGTPREQQARAAATAPFRK